MEKLTNTHKFPQSDSIKELAEFWDNHDLTDFEDQLEEVTQVVFEREPETVMKLRLQPQEAQTVKRLAETKGIPQETLLQEWVIEKLHEHQGISS